jgi:hypothetical protein
MIWGDSHAYCILPAIDQIAREHGVAAMTAWYTSTAPVLGYAPPAKLGGFSLGEESLQFNQAVYASICAQKVPNVLLAARWSGYFEVESKERGQKAALQFGAALVETIRKIRAAGSTPWILLEVPGHQVAVPKALASHEIFGTDIRRYNGTPGLEAIKNRSINNLKEELVSAGAKLIDVSDLLLDPTGHYYMMNIKETALYFDSHHLTQAGARFLSPAFKSLVAP